MVLAIVLVAEIMDLLDSTVITIAAPTVRHELGGSTATMQWWAAGYTLAFGVFMIIGGRLGDVFGRRRIFVVGIVGFTAASAACALAPSPDFLVVMRVLQGGFGALLIPQGLGMIKTVFPPSEMGGAFAAFGPVMGLAAVGGPILAGWLVSADLLGTGWRMIFLVNLPLGILNVLLAYRFLPVDRRRETTEQRAGFDAVGTLLLAVTLAAYALAMTIGRGQFGPLNIALLLAAVVGAGSFVLVEARVASPLIRLAMFREPVLRASLAMSALVSTVMMATLVVGPFYLARGLGLQTALVGLVLSAGPLVAALTGVPAGRIVDRFGAQRMTVVGLVGIACGSSVLSMMPVRFGIAGYIAPIVVITASYALFQAANNTAIMTDIHPDQRGVISGMLSLSRNLGLITG
ncbi:MAG TPA: MFS transporter, partial [Gaiellales bacterium]|nr:MFS transporter [Gaiellales bacterium]